MSKWVGYAVSVNCGEPLGCYQGTILAADGTTITLTKAFRNGFPYPKSQVTLNAADIKELKIIEARCEPTEQTHSTVAVSKGGGSGKKTVRATVCENLQANPSSSGNQPSQQSGGGGKAGNSRGGGGGTAPSRSKPIDIAGARSGKSNNHAGSYGPTGSTPKARGAGGGGAGGGAVGGGGSGGGSGGLGGGHEKARRRNEMCFGEAAEPSLDTDFDFEGNLALFDKRALWQQMNNQKPDLVRQADDKFRHDENVLGGGVPAGGTPAARRGIRVPDALRGPRDYVTDEGCVVPAVTAAARRALWQAVRRAHLGPSAQALLARATADVCIRLVGGCRRLEPRNAHQAPVAVVVAGGGCGSGAGWAGRGAALIAARLLHSHGVTVHCYLPPSGGAGGSGDRVGDGSGGSAEEAMAQQRELAALALSEIPVAERLQQLPKPDLVLLALHPPAPCPPHPKHYNECMQWVRCARACVVALEPAEGEGEEGVGEGGVTCRASVVALLPPALGVRAGRVYLADVAPPPRLFQELRILYRPPFGAASTLALHPADP